ncbi:hypothetical protein CFK37_18225 [Virgibacillus phasianinus]|uniref:Uncharacterized protein n=1 Tax=Virgibacillus phasianinus TaxID=2017483 RepID=A0A220U755_9BACI|nr:hypothetical protein CFK37_18225 [Virgibacillus phasianinus]
MLSIAENLNFLNPPLFQWPQFGALWPKFYLLSPKFRAPSPESNLYTDKDYAFLKCKINFPLIDLIMILLRKNL